MALYPRAWLAAALCAALPVHAVEVSGPRVETGPGAGRGTPVGTSGQQGQSPLATQLRLDLGGSIRPVSGAPALAPAAAASAAQAPAQAVPTALDEEKTLRMRVPAALAASAAAPAARALPQGRGDGSLPLAAPAAENTGIGSVDKVAQTLGAAGQAEKKGQVGATEKALDAVFEGRAKGSETGAVAAGAARGAAPSGLKKAGKAPGLARQTQNAVAWFAPELYEQALDAAKAEARTGADYQRFAADLDAALAQKAEARFKFTMRAALEAAQQGSLDPKAAESLMRSAVFWSGKMFGVKVEGLRDAARALDKLNEAAKKAPQPGHTLSFGKKGAVLEVLLNAQTAKELAAKAKLAPALEAPALYDQALDAAKREAKTGDEYTKFVAELNAYLAANAETSMLKALAAAQGLAQSGALARDKRNQAMGAIGFWAELLPGKVDGMAKLDATLEQIQELARAGKQPQYQMSVEKGPGGMEIGLKPAATVAAMMSKWTKKPPAPSLGRFQPKSGAEPISLKDLKPAPKESLVAGATAKVKSAAAAIKTWLAAKAAEEEAPAQTAAAEDPVLAPEPAARPAEAQPAFVSLTLEAPRGVRKVAGYELLFAPGGARGEAVERAAPVLELERSGSPESVARLRRRFDVFNRLIETNFAALELMAQSSGKMTVKTAKALAGKVRDMAAAYKELAGGSEESLEYLARLKKVEGLLAASYGNRADSELASEFTTALVMTLDRESLHKLINELHQAALDAVGRAEGDSESWETNLTVRLKQGEKAHEVPLVDLSEHPLVRGRHMVSPVLRALVDGMRRAHDTPKGSLIAQDHQFWGHFQLGAHKAEVYANFLPPDEGGMVRVRYQEWGDGLANQSRLYYVARILERLGFAVVQENGFLTAVIDKDHAAQSVEQMMDRFSVVLQSLHSTVGVDFALPIILQGSKSSQESGQRIDEWVDIVIGEGDLPFYVNDNHDAMVKGFRERQAEDARALALKTALSAFLVRLGLPAMPGDAPFGQRTLDRHYNRPLEAAVARGEVKVLMDGSLSRAAAYDPLGQLARDAAQDARSAGQLAEAVGSLDPQLFSFQTIGAVGTLTAQRAQRRLDDGRWLTLYALRDPQTGQVGLARAEVGAAGVGVSPRPIPAATLFELLAREGHPVAAFTPSAAPAGLSATLRRMREAPPQDDNLGEAFRGLAASPGKGRAVVGRITYDKARAEKGGALFLAAYTTPDDLEAIRKSKAVITTSGGLLSHAAITTREMSIPAVILGHAEWKDGAAVLESPSFGKPRQVSGALARDVASRKSVALREGAVARLDPVTGVVEVFPDAMGGAMLELAAALERLDSGGDAAAFAAWAKDRLGERRGTSLERMALGRELLREVAQRASGRSDAVSLVSRVLAAMPRGGEMERVMTEEAETHAFSEQLRAGASELRDLGDVAREAASVESLERALLKASARVDRLQSLALAFGRPAGELGPVQAAYQGIVGQGRERMAALVAEDIADLQRHAKEFPSMTVEALPRIRALIAKAKRRKLSPQLYSSWEAQAERLEAQRLAAQKAQAPSVLPLSSILDVDVPWVGGKASKLGEVMQVVAAAGGEVPQGFALTIHAYRRFLREAGLEARIDKLGSDAKLSLEERSARIRELIVRAPLSADKGVGAEILKALKAQKMEGTALAVRSSAVDEDGADAAFAGAGDTHLYVQGDELLSHVREVWSSLWNPRALQYRQAKGLSLSNLNQAVVVQAMAPSEVAGVAFTQDPVSGNSGRLIVNAAFGLGEGVVSGRVAPDQYVVSKADGREVLPAMIADKKLAIVPQDDGRGTKEKRVEASRRRARALSPLQLQKLERVAHALERHFGYALDIEFGFVGDKLYILQSRPVTHAAEGAGEQRTGREPLAPKKVVFVCTGNTCRSAMAEAMARAALARHGRSDVAVASRGLAVSVEGQPMSSGARAALKARGIDAVSHSAATLSAADVAASDLILAMTAQHAWDILRRHPEAEGKVFTLAGYAGAGGDIDDPYGGGPSAFEASARSIETAVDAVLDELSRGEP